MFSRFKVRVLSRQLPNYLGHRFRRFQLVHQGRIWFGVSWYYEDRRENISTQQQRASMLGLTQLPPPETVNQTYKENSDMGVDFVEVPNLKSHEPRFKKTNHLLFSRISEIKEFLFLSN